MSLPSAEKAAAAERAAQSATLATEIRPPRVRPAEPRRIVPVDRTAESAPAVALVMPVANERATIEETWAGIAGLDVGPLVWIPVLDSVSRDGTREWLAGLALADRRVRPIDLGLARGLAHAYLSGYREALRLGAEKILEIDAGLSHPIGVVPEMVRALDHVAHVTTTRHAIGGRSENVPWRRRLLSRVGTWIGRGLLGVPLTDATGGLQGFRREALESIDLDSFLSRYHMVQTELKYRCRHLSRCEIPVVHVGNDSTLRLRAVTDAARVTVRLALDRFGVVRLPERTKP